MTFTVDPSSLLQIMVIVFGFGAAWAGLSLRMRYLERRQDAAIDAFKQSLSFELQAIRDAHKSHVEQYQRETDELRQKLEGKGESVTTLLERVSQMDRRIDEKFDQALERIGQQFRELAKNILDSLKPPTQAKVASAR